MPIETSPLKLISSESHHAPSHRFSPGLTYMVTGATLYRKHFFRSHKFLSRLEKDLLETLARNHWSPQAWCAFSNHYHFIGKAQASATPLRQLIGKFHSKTALWVNQHDGATGRRVWYQYWDRCLTFQSSYLARLNYVNNNPVRHGLVRRAADYPYCSASSFETQFSARVLQRLSTYGHKRVKEPDEFEPVWEIRRLQNR